MSKQPLTSAAAVLDGAAHLRSGMLADLAALVAMESPSDHPGGIDRCARLVQGWLEALGGQTRLLPHSGYGPLLVSKLHAKGAKKVLKARSGDAVLPVLLLGHLDTVWARGTLETMPFRIGDGRAWGPGVLDMKAGVVMAVAALRLLREIGGLARPVTVLLVSDEEIGSPVSRATTEAQARECGAVFVLEPAQGLAGACKTARKGVANYTLRVRGVAAHSGVDFERGHSAVLELARQIERVSAFTDLARGITVNAGRMGGGTRPNVVAAEASAEFDVRIARRADAARMERRFRALRAVDPHCRLELTGGFNRPPMERTPGNAALFRRAATLAARMGFKLEEAATGGASDGNFTSALGIPTLDGMGAVGEGAHADHESILLDALVPRTALLAAMTGDLDLDASQD